MNERIREFAVAAGGYEVAPHDFLFRQENLQKFTELIVGECANICFSEADGHRIAFGEHCGIVIKQHFGVEE